MSFADWNEIIQRELRPEFIDTVIYDKIEPFTRWFTTQEALKGDRITSKYRLSHTSSAAAYNKNDVDAAPATHVLGKPYWTKVFTQGAIEVHGIDLSNDRPGGATLDMVADQLRKETEKIADVDQAKMLAQLLADVDSSGTAYSDASLSRSTYPLLASYEETTDATVTLAYVRGMIQNVTLNKGVSLSDYVCLMEGSVYYTFKPLAAALHTLNMETVAGVSKDMGYPDVANFEGLRIAPPSDFTNMTTGSVFMLRRPDVNVVTHRPLDIVAKESGRDSIKFSLYTGTQLYVDNPYLQGKMLSKD
jgi:hypothetical protein